MKQFSLLVLFLLVSLNVWGQEEKKYRSMGRIGIGQSTFPGLPENSGVLHLFAGFGGTYSFNDMFSISAEGLLGTLGSRYEGFEERSGTVGTVNEPYTGRINFFSVNIPIYPSFTIGSDEFKFVVHAGPSINFNLFGTERRTYENESYESGEFTDSYEVSFFSLVYGVGVRVRTGDGNQVFLDLRNNTGLTNTYKTTDNVNPQNTRVDYFSISTGYIF